MSWWSRAHPRKSARALIIQDGKLLTFRRKRHSRKTGEWIEYYSIPGGGIDGQESPEAAAVRELKEEMGIAIEVGPLLAHRISSRFEHYVYEARILDGKQPTLQQDSEEALSMHSANQFIVEWVPVGDLTTENLRYYCDYLELIQQLARGKRPSDTLYIDAR